MEVSLKNKRVLITGAGDGIGRELTKCLHKGGAFVTALSNISEQLESLKKECPGIVISVTDVTDDGLRNEIRRLGPFDCVVNNAGIALLQPFLETTETAFDKCFNINVRALFIISQEVAKQMIDNKIKGSIVNVSSQASQVASENHLVYCGTKGAVDIMSKVMACELGNYGIRVNCVNPTVVLTASGIKCWSDPKKADPVKTRIPLHRFAEVEEVVNAIVFLLSDKASMINAVTLPVDGGFLAT